MRQIVLAASAACLVAGCSLTPAQKTAMLKIGCVVDGVVQPITAPLVASLGPGGASVASADTLLVHPTVVAACEDLGGTPAVMATPAPAIPPPRHPPHPRRPNEPAPWRAPWRADRISLILSTPRNARRSPGLGEQVCTPKHGNRCSPPHDGQLGDDNTRADPGAIPGPLLSFQQVILPSRRRSVASRSWGCSGTLHDATSYWLTQTIRCIQVTSDKSKP